MKKDTHRELPEKQAAHPLLEMCGSTRQGVLPGGWIIISRCESVFGQRMGMRWVEVERVVDLSTELEKAHWIL